MTDSPNARREGPAAWQASARHAVRLALLWLLLGLPAMGVVQMQINSRFAHANCPPPVADAVSCLGGLDPSSLTLELAGSGKRLACQLHPVASAMAAAAPTQAERVCIEARVQARWDELTQLDERLLMPVYGLFSLLIAAWVALQAPSGQLASPAPVGHRRLVAAAALSFTTVLLLVLDAQENASAMALLIDAERGPLSLPHRVALDAVAAAARQASLHKWAASSLWAAALAWALFEWRGAKHPWQRWPLRIAIGAAGFAAAMFVMAVAVAINPLAFAGPIRLLQAGFALAILAMLAAALAVKATRTATAPIAATGSVSPARVYSRADVQDQIDAAPAGAREFHLEEYRQLRSEVVGLLARIEMLLRSAMVVAATVFGWLVVHSLGVTEDSPPVTCLKLPRELLWFAWLIPPAFVLCTGLMARVAHRRITEMGTYLRRLEQALGHSTLGWEAYVSQQRSVLTSMAQQLWWILFLLTIAAAMLALIAVEQAVGGCPLKA